MRAEVEETETYVFNDSTGQLCRKGREAGIHETRCNRKSNQSDHAFVTIVTPRLQCDSSWSFWLPTSQECALEFPDRPLPPPSDSHTGRRASSPHLVSILTILTTMTATTPARATTTTTTRASTLKSARRTTTRSLMSRAHTHKHRCVVLLFFSFSFGD